MRLSSETQGKIVLRPCEDFLFQVLWIRTTIWRFSGKVLQRPFTAMSKTAFQDHEASTGRADSDSKGKGGLTLRLKDLTSIIWMPFFHEIPHTASRLACCIPST
jgi:hypothetical protein